VLQWLLRRQDAGKVMPASMGECQKMMQFDKTGISAKQIRRIGNQ
jgi:hypothetical protein